MNKALLLIVANLGSLACLIGAVLLALNDKSGWGWFLAAGIVLGVQMSFVAKP